MGPESAPEVVEVVPGDYEVRTAGRRIRVLVPAGVGAPGIDEQDLAGAVVGELLARGADVPDVIDVSALLREEPALLHTVADRLDEDA